MRKSISIFATLAVVSVILAWNAAWPLHAQDESSVDAPAAILDNYELMEFLVDPFYVDLRNAARGEPEGRKTWRALYVATYRLSEVANLLYFREDKEYMKTEEWRRMATQMRDYAVSIGDAVKERDIDLIRSRYETLIQNCNDCHVQFEPDDHTEVEAW